MLTTSVLFAILAGVASATPLARSETGDHAHATLMRRIDDAVAQVPRTPMLSIRSDKLASLKPIRSMRAHYMFARGGLALAADVNFNQDVVHIENFDDTQCDGNSVSFTASDPSEADSLKKGSYVLLSAEPGSGCPDRLPFILTSDAAVHGKRLTLRDLQPAGQLTDIATVDKYQFGTAEEIAGFPQGTNGTNGTLLGAEIPISKSLTYDFGKTIAPQTYTPVPGVTVKASVGVLGTMFAKLTATIKTDGLTPKALDLTLLGELSASLSMGLDIESTLDADELSEVKMEKIPGAFTILSGGAAGINLGLVVLAGFVFEGDIPGGYKAEKLGPVIKWKKAAASVSLSSMKPYFSKDFDQVAEASWKPSTLIFNGKANQLDPINPTVNAYVKLCAQINEDNDTKDRYGHVCVNVIAGGKFLIGKTTKCPDGGNFGKLALNANADYRFKMFGFQDSGLELALFKEKTAVREDCWNKLSDHHHSLEIDM